MYAYCKAYNDRIGQNPCKKAMPYLLPYVTGEEFTTLRNELEIARQEILLQYPNLKGEYELRASYSKYSKESDHLSSLLPSLVRYVSIGRNKPRMLNKMPSRQYDNYGNPLAYHEYVFDKNGKLLMSKIYWNNLLQVVLYVVEHGGYTYILDLDEDDYNFDCYVSRMRYEGNKLIKYEEYEPIYGGGWYYCEIYYNLDGREYCTALFLDHKYGREHLPYYSFSSFSDQERAQMNIFLSSLKLPITDERSPVCAFAYELSFDDRGKVKQIDEISLYSGVVKTIYPKKPMVKSSLPKTNLSRKKLLERLRAVSQNSKNLSMAFSDFWQTFKDFCKNDKFDCADDSILWEPILSVDNVAVHIARQFVHENDGIYEGMQQLNIDFDVPVDECCAEAASCGVNWSQEDLNEYFGEIEQSKVFQSIDIHAIINVEINFDEV